MEYPEGCSTAIRHVARKAGLYNLEMISPQRCNFQMDGLAYDTLEEKKSIESSEGNKEVSR